MFFFFSVGGSGSEDHASDANLQDFEAGSSLYRPQSLRLHTETVLPAGLTAPTACVNKPIKGIKYGQIHVGLRNLRFLRLTVIKQTQSFNIRGKYNIKCVCVRRWAVCCSSSAWASSCFQPWCTLWSTTFTTPTSPPCHTHGGGRL